jgi:hypothetical protein
LWHHPWLIAWLVITLGGDGGRSAASTGSTSQFWHDDDMRLKLRKALGLG